ncbi:MAG: metallophosphatase [Bacteroidetes bacterium MED-G13]|nr:MAG: metallophosphatase [Bacteroidetes bacterium MED-G13]|tara:strand:- start:4496 stop:5407 length:912 start_codon:yes stop_codon:yes gene_type:complete
MNRRNFLKNSIYASAGIASSVCLSSCNNEKSTTVSILHTNDVHSHITPFDNNHSEYPNQGGFSRRSTLVSEIRRKNPNTLLFDAGDVFQGTPYFNVFEGELEFKLMSLLKYDAMTIGNHDFDNGILGLKKQISHASFDFICSNYDFSNTILEGKTSKYKVYKKSNIKIGVFGLGIKLTGLVSKNLFKETKYLDPLEMAQEMSNQLKKNEKCDLVVCLSHLGYKYKDEDKICDHIIAKNTRYIDLIIGGHTHTFMKKPETVKNKIGKQVLINQVGCFGLYLGKVDFEFYNKKLKSKFFSNLSIF